jgi:hypothetical protein
MSYRIFITGCLLAVLAAAVAVAGCGSSGTDLNTGSTAQSPSASGPTSTGATTAAASTTGTITTSGDAYNPKIDPATFTDEVTNTYLPLKPGTTRLYSGTRDGVPTQTKVSVLTKPRTVMGIKCVVVSDVVTQNHSLVEKTSDWYAQDAKGNVWYFGEDTAEYANGTVTSTDGSWEAGVDHALPGMVMEANPKVGDHFRQEYRPGIAEDKATILDLNGTAKTPAGSYKNLVVTHDINPLDPTKHERKWYAKGIGFVHAVLHQGGHVEISGLAK